MAMRFGGGNLLFEPVEGWEKLPEGWSFIDVAGVAVDTRDNVYVFNRGEHPVVVFDRGGNLLRSFGEGLFSQRPHGIHTGPNESVYCVDVGLHTGRMTFDQAIDYFTEHVSFYPLARLNAAGDPAARAITESAQRAIYRYSKWPTQAITYNLGKNAIIELREACRAATGADFSAKTFHERFMGMGPVPVAHFRDNFLAGCTPTASTG